MSRTTSSRPKRSGSTGGPRDTGRSTSPGSPWSPWPPACSPRSATSACPTVTCAKPQSRACGSGFSRSPAGSPTDNARPGCTYPPTGPGPPTSRKLADHQDPADPDLTRSRQPQRPGAQYPGPWNPAPPTRQSVPTPTHRTEIHDQKSWAPSTGGHPAIPVKDPGQGEPAEGDEEEEAPAPRRRAAMAGAGAGGRP